MSIGTITVRPERDAAAGFQPADTISRSDTHSLSSQSQPLFFWICRAKSQKEINGLSDSHSCPLQTNSPSAPVMSANYIKAPSDRQLLENHLNQDLKPAARKEKSAASHLNMLCAGQWASLWFLHTYIINLYSCKHRFEVLCLSLTALCWRKLFIPSRLQTSVTKRCITSSSLTQ